MMSEELPPAQQRGWIRRFADAVRGVQVAMPGEASFLVHFLVATLVIIAGAVLAVSAMRWCLLVICITVVLTAEMFNTAIERLARAVTRDQHPEIRDALDIASAAVLVAAIGAAVVGLIVLGGPLLAWLASR